MKKQPYESNVYMSFQISPKMYFGRVVKCRPMRNFNEKTNIKNKIKIKN